MSNLSLPTPDTPLYNHTLPDIEQWLQAQGCEQDSHELHLWRMDRPTWKAELWLDIEELTVVYKAADDQGLDIRRSFKYSLSRLDMEAAIFAGP